MESYTGSSLETSSLALYGSSKEILGKDLVVPGGLRQVTGFLTSKLNSSQLMLDSPVTKISYEAEKTVIEYRDGTEGQHKGMTANVVIVTLPVGVPQERAQEMFTPPLPRTKVRRKALIQDFHNGNKQLL